MKQRSKSYLGSFVNSPEGISSYRLMVKHIRQVVTGGRFLKMYRGNRRPSTSWTLPDGRKYTNWSGSSRKEGATHFDVYLLWKDGKPPKFYNFELRGY